MGVEEVVTSPTFALVRSYPTAFGIELIHADVYRLDHLADIVALGLPEMIDDGAVAVIEWGERAGPAVGAERLHVRLSLTDVEGERRLTLVPEGTRWRARWDDLSATLAQDGAGRR
jgi:tRNA threonylcarbamoyladenosine biosynthesis protein TsaE